MGIGCCNYNKTPKERELIFQKKIKYSIYEINKILNYNNENIMTNANEQDKISTSSQEYGFERRYESIDSSPNLDNNYQSNNITTKNSILGQIKETEQKYEQDRDNNSYNQSFSEIEKISVNHLIKNVDKIYINSINNNNDKNNINKCELKRMKQINLNNMEDSNKMNNYNINNEMQWKIGGDFNNENIYFENFDDNYNEENKTIEVRSKNKNNNNNKEIQNQNLDETNNVKIEFYKIDNNNMFNNDSKNNEFKNPNSQNINKHLICDKGSHNDENNDFNRDTNYKDNKDSCNAIDNLDDLLIDNNNLNVNKKNNICHTKNINNGDENNNKFNFKGEANGGNVNSLSEIEKKDYIDSLDSINKEEIRTSLYHKKKIIKIPKERK